jgi:hypothetical protein
VMPGFATGSGKAGAAKVARISADAKIRIFIGAPDWLQFYTQ